VTGTIAGAPSPAPPVARELAASSGFLLARLERQAAASGVGRMTAETLIINRPMLRLARRAGYSVSVGAADAGHVHLEKSFTDQTDAADLSLSTPSKTAA